MSIQNITIDRSLYDTANKEDSKYRAVPGVSEEVVREISKQKNEPAWMLDKRLASFALFQNTPMPTWGPNLSNLNLDEIVYFVRPNTRGGNQLG
jgi:Fe-S cluster assembly protein SufB